MRWCPGEICHGAREERNSLELGPLNNTSRQGSPRGEPPASLCPATSFYPHLPGPIALALPCNTGMCGYNWVVGRSSCIRGNRSKEANPSRRAFRMYTPVGKHGRNEIRTCRGGRKMLFAEVLRSTKSRGVRGNGGEGVGSCCGGRSVRSTS